MTSKDVNFDSWRQRFEEMLSKNLFSFWNQIDREVTSWIKANLSLDYKGVPATLYDLGSVDAHELLSDKASVLSPMSAIIGVNIRTPSSKLMIDRKPVEALTQSFGEAGGINYVDVRFDDRVVIGAPLDIRADVIVRLIPKIAERQRVFNVEVNNVAIKNLI